MTHALADDLDPGAAADDLDPDAPARLGHVRGHVWVNGEILRADARHLSVFDRASCSATAYSRRCGPAAAE